MNRSEVLSFLKDNGLETFPLKGKVPTCKWQEPYDKPIQPEENFGVKLGGNSKIFVIDVDDYSLIEHFRKYLEITYVVKTGKGFHIYIHTDDTLPPILRLNNSQGQHIDIQSTGTYVVGETSIHPDTKKHYEIISTKRNINNVDFNEVKQILEKLGFNTIKKPIKKELADAIKNGIPKGNRNNILFKLSCDILKTVQDPEIAFNHISTINQKSDEPLDKEELDQLFQSATVRVAENISENNKKFKMNDRIEYELLDESPKDLRAITLDDDKTRLILVYLPTKITENGLSTYDSKAYFITNGIDGKKILPLDDPSLKQKYVTNIFLGFKILNDKWKNKDIQRYIQSNDKVNPKEIFDNLHGLERKYFENEFDYDYYYEPCWITHTYFYTLFDLTPYNDYFGMKNVGKSKRLNFLRMLAYNGILSGDSSISSIFRTIQGTGATLLLDETENLKGGKDDRTDLENLLRNGFSKEGMVIRSKETRNKEFTPELFSVYSPKGFGHINGFDNVLDDRCIKTKLIRTTNKKIADSEPDEKEDQLIYKIRESLYRLFLDYGDEIYGLIPEAKSLIKELSGREMKLWLPIITMALFYQNHGVDGLIDKITAKMLLTSEDKKISDLEDNTDFKILQILEQTATIPTTSKQLYGLINDELAKQFNLERLGDKIIKESLERLGFRNKRTSKAVEWTNLTAEKIREAKERVGLIQTTQATLSEIDSTCNVGNVGSVAS
jgi:hypothetical protein